MIHNGPAFYDDYFHDMKTRTPISVQPGHILRVRPGIMANFSGGYGYMPLVLLVSVPLGLISTLISNSLIYTTAKRMRLQGADESEDLVRVDISRLRRHIYQHLKNCVIIYVLMGGFLALWASGSLYESSMNWYFWTIVLAAGPFLLALVSTLVLSKLILTKGVRFIFLIAGLLVYIAPFLLLIMFQAFTLYVIPFF